MKPKEWLEEVNDRIEALDDPRKKKIISSILKNSRWYLEMDVDIVISILIDLGFNKTQSVEIYKYLLSC